MQDNNKEFWEGVLDGFAKTYIAAICAFIVFLLICAICGCSKTHYVPVETVRTEYVEADTTAIYNSIYRLFESRREKTSRVDSLIDREKETIVINEQGDTTRHDTERIVYRATAREKELEVENKTLRDSVSTLNERLASIRSDSIERIVPVERELSRWEKAKMDFGGITLCVAGGALCVLIGMMVWIVKVKRKR